MTFDQFWKKRRKEHPDENKYISLCYILDGSGEDRDKIEKIFLKYMTITSDYDEPEKDQLVDYLFEIATDRQ